MSSPMEPRSILHDLNEQQRSAVSTVSGPLLIVAGAGSGKTRALTHRIAYLISTGTPGDQILALTFTNKAAEEMRTRVQRLLKSETQAARPFIGTFHAFGARMLRDTMQHLGRDTSFLIYDTKDQRALVKEILAARGISSDQLRPGAVLSTISRHKNELEGPETFTERAKNYYERIVALVWHDYEQHLREANAVDFDDLLVLPIAIMNRKPEVLSCYQRRFQHILVDEYQDTNRAQYMLLRLLARDHRNLCVVGDDWQSIYRFRGADFRNMLIFNKDWPDAKVVLLEENYRSTRPILEAAQSLIEHNQLRTTKHIWTRREEGRPVIITRTNNEDAEAVFVIREIKRLLNEKHCQTLADIAVLYRTNAQSRALEEACMDAGLPYVIIGSVRFYERKEIKDVLAYLRLLATPGDTLSLKRIANVPPRGIGPRTLEKLLAGEATGKAAAFLALRAEFADLFKTELPLSRLIETILHKIAYESYVHDGTEEGRERWENVQELVAVARKFDHLPLLRAATTFLEEIALLAPADEIVTDGSMLNMMTLHAAKGLEFDAVFIVGCEEGLLPHEKSSLSPEDLEEERRLCYVGLTRARSHLYLSFASHRTQLGSGSRALPSRFLSEIPDHLIEYVEYDEEYVDTIVLD